jgi:cobalamin biosynthetic protein CobC
MKHGGDLGAAMARHGGILSDWLDLSTGINPHCYPVPNDLGAHVWRSLPSASALERLLTAARTAYQVPGELELVAAPGTQALISLLPRVLPDGEVAIIGPTYSSHSDVWRRDGRVLHEVSSPHIDLGPAIRVAVLVNPNNPDGRLADPTTVRHLASTLASRGGLLVVDEAFADCIPGASVLPHLQGTPAVVLRSFGKFYGLAGLRLGFAAAPADLARELTRALESWAVSGPALSIGAAALEDRAWQSAMQARLADEAADMTASLQMRGLGVFGGTPLFLLARVRDAAHVQEALARQRIWTRVFDYAPSWIRLGLPGGAAGLARLENALDQAMAET